MESPEAEAIAEIYTRSWPRLPGALRQELLERFGQWDDLPEQIESAGERYNLPGYLPELAKLEAAAAECSSQRETIPRHPAVLSLNPSLSLLHLEWSGLVELLESGAEPGTSPIEPVPGEVQALLWWDPHAGRVRLQTATHEDLLILKIVADDLDLLQVAADQDLRPAILHAFLKQAKDKGLVLGPASRLRRSAEVVPEGASWAERFRSTDIFTLQWHLTQACDLHCRHCYDRSSRNQMGLEEGLRVVEELAEFCRHRHVRGQITFTGGNPLLYKHFFEIYQAAARQGFILAILGNPTDAATLEKLMAIEPPALYQVSLEGLEEHNDFIRQPGHFQKVLSFLDLLQECGLRSQVMLTLTEANLDQVVPLAEVLRQRTDRFAFNRLSMVGEGAALRLPAKETYHRFMEDYLQAAASNPVMGLKDNLLNPTLLRRGASPFGGCTGFGCGAAFNFITLLPDGEVHACRKLPSPLGNLKGESLASIYDNRTAEAYRRAPEACGDCSLRPVCRGCLAVAYSAGLNVFTDRDPLCDAVWTEAPVVSSSA
jgi:selenobiotic family peptide radical SAM maturase